MANLARGADGFVLVLDPEDDGAPPARRPRRGRVARLTPRDHLDDRRTSPRDTGSIRGIHFQFEREPPPTIMEGRGEPDPERRVGALPAGAGRTDPDPGRKTSIASPAAKRAIRNVIGKEHAGLAERGRSHALGPSSNDHAIR
jgi:hypothetical protein